jgi:hypothetical protein
LGRSHRAYLILINFKILLHQKFLIWIVAIIYSVVYIH